MKFHEEQLYFSDRNPLWQENISRNKVETRIYHNENLANHFTSEKNITMNYIDKLQYNKDTKYQKIDYLWMDELGAR